MHDEESAVSVPLHFCNALKSRIILSIFSEQLNLQRHFVYTTRSCAYTHTSSSHLHIICCVFVCLTVPPDIINEESSADLAVQEGEDATLTCKATGNPIPRVIWRREDGDIILIRKPGSRELIKGMYARFYVPRQLVFLRVRMYRWQTAVEFECMRVVCTSASI